MLSHNGVKFAAVRCNRLQTNPGWTPRHSLSLRCVNSLGLPQGAKCPFTLSLGRAQPHVTLDPQFTDIRNYTINQSDITQDHSVLCRILSYLRQSSDVAPYVSLRQLPASVAEMARRQMADFERGVFNASLKSATPSILDQSILGSGVTGIMPQRVTRSSVARPVVPSPPAAQLRSSQSDRALEESTRTMNIPSKPFPRSSSTVGHHDHPPNQPNLESVQASSTSMHDSVDLSPIGHVRPVILTDESSIQSPVRLRAAASSSSSSGL